MDFESIFKFVAEKVPNADRNIISTITRVRSHFKISSLREAKNIVDAWREGIRFQGTTEQQIQVAQGYWLACEFKRLINNPRYSDGRPNYNYIGFARGLA